MTYTIHEPSRTYFPAQPITPDEEIELVKIYQNPKSSERARAEALDTLTRAHMRFICQIALRVHNRTGHPLDDLTSEGWLGFAHALTKYDPSKGYRLLTYAGPWIQQHMQRWGHSNDIIRLPEWIHEKGEQSKYAQPLSLDKAYRPSNGNREMELIDFVPDRDARPVDQTAIAGLMSADIRSALACLGEQKRRVLSLRHGIDAGPYTLEEIGRMLGVTRERVRQIEQQAMIELRRILEARNICDTPS